jgi:beta-glucosidase-like glycosyl hydrolase
VTLPLGRLILPALRWSDQTRYGHEEPVVAAALEAGAGGFIVFGGPADEVRSLTASLVERAGRPLLIGADLERGAGQQFAGLAEIPPPRALASLRDLPAIRAAGAITAREARSVGVNWVFAPVADLDLLPTNPIVQTRSFGSDPADVARCVRAWIDGCQSAGAAACVKHYPGHGRTSTDSHAELPVVDEPAATLRSTDGAPFDAAIAEGVAGVMTAHVAYPALDASRRPATLSRPILEDLRARGFDGAIVSDALIMEGAFVGRSEAAAYVEAMAAGVDLLLYPKDVRGAVAALSEGVAAGTLGRERIADATRRYEVLLELACRPAPAVNGLPATTSLADRLVTAGLRRGTAPELRAPLELLVVDDDVGGPYPASPSDWVALGLAESGVQLGPGGSRVVLAFAEPRAWKGRGGFGARSLEQLRATAPDADLVVLFAHPRLAADIPHGPRLLLAWHRQHLMQDAVARWLAAATLRH